MGALVCPQSPFVVNGPLVLCLTVIALTWAVATMLIASPLQSFGTTPKKVPTLPVLGVAFRLKFSVTMPDGVARSNVSLEFTLETLKLTSVVESARALPLEASSRQWIPLVPLLFPILRPRTEARWSRANWIGLFLLAPFGLVPVKPRYGVISVLEV